MLTLKGRIPREGFYFLKQAIVSQGCRFVPYTFSETKPEMVPTDLITLQGTNISPSQGIFEDNFPLAKVGYVNSLEGIDSGPNLYDPVGPAALLRSFLRPPIGSFTLPLGSWKSGERRSWSTPSYGFWCYTFRNLTKHKTRHPVKSYHPKTRDGDDADFLFGDSCLRFPLLMTNSGLMSNRRDFTSGSFCVFFLQHWKLKKKHPGKFTRSQKAHPVRFASTWSGRKGAQNHSLRQARRFFRGSLHEWQSMCAAVQAPKVPRISRQFAATVHRRLVTPKGS